MSIRIFAVFISLLVTACASNPPTFDNVNVDQINVGQSTERDILEWFGEPYEIHTDTATDSTHKLVYRHINVRFDAPGTIPAREFYNVSTGRQVTHRTILEVWFDDEGVVKDYKYDRRPLGRPGANREPNNA